MNSFGWLTLDGRSFGLAVSGLYFRGRVTSLTLVVGTMASGDSSSSSLTQRAILGFGTGLGRSTLRDGFFGIGGLLDLAHFSAFDFLVHDFKAFHTYYLSKREPSSMTFLVESGALSGKYRSSAGLMTLSCFSSMFKWPIDFLTLAGRRIGLCLATLPPYSLTSFGRVRMRLGRVLFFGRMSVSCLPSAWMLSI